MTKYRKWKRILAGILTATMIATAMPSGAYAAEENSVERAAAEVLPEGTEETVTETQEAASGEQAVVSSEGETEESENSLLKDSNPSQDGWENGTEENRTEDMESKGSSLSDNLPDTEKQEDAESTTEALTEEEMQTETEEETAIDELIVTATMYSSEYDKKLHEINVAFPHGSTWNDALYDKGIQCFGYAHWVADKVFGGSSINWGKVYDMNSVKAGDIVQYGNTSGQGHTIFVTAVSGNTITYTDANSDYHNTVKWGQTIAKNAALYGYSFSYVKSNPKKAAALRGR